MLHPLALGLRVHLPVLLMVVGVCCGIGHAQSRTTERAGAGEFPNQWYYYQGKSPSVQRLRELEGKPAPALPVTDWVGKEQTLEQLKGKVVVVDFWGTWCRPCMAAIPKNIALMNKYKDQGLVVLGVHSKKYADRMPDAVRRSGINYPVAADTTGRAARAWRVGFWPTYAVLDRQGVVRAAGLVPDRIANVVDQLLSEPAGSVAKPAAPAPAPSRDDRGDRDRTTGDTPAALPANWLEGNASHRRKLDQLLNAPAPVIRSARWMNSDPLTAQQLEGKVVLLDFWATWCGPCIKSIPKINAMQQKYADQGLVVIGVCHPRGSEKMGQTVQQKAIAYPVCVDSGGKMAARYGVDSYPDYYLIDRAGRLRIADCRNGVLEEAVKMLLAE